MQTAKEYGQMARYLKAYGVDPTPELIQQIMAGNQHTPQESNIQRAYRSMPQGYGYAYNPGMYNPGQQAKKGKEVKDVVLPFYLGTIGG
jgi:hypothetical protein